MIDTDKKAGDAFYEFLRPFLNSEHAERISILHDAVMPKMKKDGESLQSEARLKKAAAERGMSLWQYIYTTALTKLREAVEADPDLSAFLQANPSQSPRQPEPDVHTEKSPGTRLPKSARDNARRFRRRQGVMSFAASLREKGGLPERDNDVPHVRALLDLLEPFWGGEHEAELWEQYKQWTRLTDDDRAAYQAEAERRGVSPREVIFSEAHKYITDYIRRRPHLRDIAWPPREHTTYRSYELRSLQDGHDAYSGVAEGDAKTSGPHLSEGQMLVLLYLAKQAVLRCQVDIAAGVDRDRKTVGSWLKYLRVHGLVERPKGPRSGEAITDAGKRCVSQFLEECTEDHDLYGFAVEMGYSLNPH